MTEEIERREFLKLAGLGGIVFLSALHPMPGMTMAPRQTKDFFFVQLSDSHWGFEGATINPDAKGTLLKAVKEVNALRQKPDFVVFTGDLTQTTNDVKVRRSRMKGFQEIVAELDTKLVYYMPGEHDAALDKGETYKEFFGETHYSFDHRGVHFIAIDNVCDPTGSIGEAQLEWLKNDLSTQKTDAHIVVLTHRPLFDLYPKWDWSTKDGSEAIELLMPFANVTVFYGHIHREHHQMTGHIAHHSANSLMLPMPAAGSVPKRMPVEWSAAEPYRGMGFRNILSQTAKGEFQLTEYGINAEGKIR